MITVKQGFHITATKGSLKLVKHEILECTTLIVIVCGLCDEMFGVHQRFSSNIMVLIWLMSVFRTAHNEHCG